MTPNIYYGASLVAQMVKYQPAKQGPRFNPWVWKIPREGNGNPVQYSCLENSMDRETWWATIQGVTTRWTQLSN